MANLRDLSIRQIVAICALAPTVNDLQMMLDGFEREPSIPPTHMDRATLRRAIASIEAIRAALKAGE